VRADARYREAARDALLAARGIISGNREVLDRILALYPDDRAALEEKSAIVGVGVDTALFRPVARADRAAEIARLEGPFPGKAPAQGDELRSRLDAGDYAALTGYRDAYDHGAPDADAAEKLARVPWDRAGVLLFVGALTAGKGVQGLLAALPRVLARHPDTHLLVVGSGSYREVLEALVHALATGDEALFGHLRAHGFDLDRSELTGGWPDVGGVNTAKVLSGRDGRVLYAFQGPRQAAGFGQSVAGIIADLGLPPAVLPVFLQLFDAVVDEGNGAGSVLGSAPDAFSYARVDVEEVAGEAQLTLTVRGNPDYLAGANDPGDVVDLFSITMP